jgi:phage terminase large subunit-like protein
MGEGSEGAVGMIWTPDNSDLLLYKAEIESGKILVGQELYMELENLAEDLQHNDDYYYDTDSARLRMDFMENCIQLTKSPFYGLPMRLMLWQKAFIEALYSFKMARELRDNNKVIDRFKKALLLVARKNTKSETCSALGNAEFIVGNEGSDLVCSSNDDAQASIVYDAMDTMRKLYDPDDLDTKRNQRFILNKATTTKVFKLSDRTRNKEGRNIDWAILDEAHEMQTNVIAKSIEQSQSLKENPKFIIITTEGFVVDGYLDQELRTARAIIKGEDDSISAQRFLPWLYTQDSEQEIFQNPKSWQKSNPTIGIIKRVDYLEEQVDLAKKSKADRIFVLSKDFNIKQGGAESWLNVEDYTYDARYDLEQFRGCYCLGHVDLAETTDLCCCKALVMRPDDPVKYILTMYFIPQSKLDPENDDHNAGARYKEWAREGYITICEGNDIDLTMCADWFFKLLKEHGIKLYKCGYDQRFAKDWLRRMDEYGWTKQYGDVEMVLQNAQTLNNAILLVEADLKARLINYNENPVDRWCFSNSCLKVNDLRQAIVIKTENSKKIDGSVTLVSLYEMYRRYRSDLKKLVGGAT